MWCFGEQGHHALPLSWMIGRRDGRAVSAQNRVTLQSRSVWGPWRAAALAGALLRLIFPSAGTLNFSCRHGQPSHLHGHIASAACLRQRSSPSGQGKGPRRPRCRAAMPAAGGRERCRQQAGAAATAWRRAAAAATAAGGQQHVAGPAGM